MKAPMTDKTLGIYLHHHERFSEIRAKAHDEYIERCKRRKKEKELPVPKYKPGDVVISANQYGTRYYRLVEIIDFEYSYGNIFDYYCILIKTTNPKELPRIGRIVSTSNWRSFDQLINIPPDSPIKWLENKDATP